MAAWLQLTWGTGAFLVAAVATLGVAVFVAWLAFSKPVHRAFALFLLVKALADGSLAFTSTSYDLASRLRPYWFIALPFAALHFALVFRWRYAGRLPRPSTRRAALIAIAFAAGACELAYALDHGLFHAPRHDGPLLVFGFMDGPAYAGVALLFIREAVRARGAGRAAFLPAALGMSLPPLFTASFRCASLLLGTLRGHPPTFQAPFQLIEDAMLAVIVALLALVARRFLALRPAQGIARAAPLAWGLALLTGLLAATVEAVTASNASIVLLQALLALWSLAIPILVTYALVRHRLFGADVRFTIKASTLTGLFVAVFLVVDQLVQAISSQAFGAVAGAVAAGLLLFAIHPLRRFAEGLAERANRPGRAAALPHGQRVALFREHLEVAWGDGVLTRKERLMFDRLRSTLGISADEAAALEREVLGRAAAGEARSAASAAAAPP